MNTLFVLLLTLATALVLFLWLSPANIAYFLRRGMPFALIGLGALLLVLRQTALGSLALFVGITWLRRAGGVGSFGPRAPLGNKTQQSTVRSAALEMRLDHETGAMSGQILAGKYEGRILDDLELEDLAQLRDEIRNDTQSLALLDAYLDRRSASWREHAHFDGATGEVGTPASGPMGKKEAYEVLGLEPGASAADIRKAHRRLMKTAHPDSGGSTFLAAKINEAKDVLLKSHT